MFVQQFSGDCLPVYHLEFPASTDQKNHKFSTFEHLSNIATFTDYLKIVVYLKILTIINELLRTNKIVTKRDIFYNEKALFRTQYVVDRAVDHIALSLGIERQALNIVASPKGLIYADLTLTTKAGQVLEFSKANGVSIIFSVTNDNIC